MVTCYIRYKLNMDKLDAFTEYGRIWIKIINELGGIHHGYFLPSDDPKVNEYNTFSFSGLGSKGEEDVAIAVFSFPNWEAYEQYRAEAGKHPDCARSNELVAKTKCFSSYERNFMTAVFS